MNFKTVAFRGRGETRAQKTRLYSRLVGRHTLLHANVDVGWNSRRCVLRSISNLYRAQALYPGASILGLFSPPRASGGCEPLGIDPCVSVMSSVGKMSPATVWTFFRSLVFSRSPQEGKNQGGYDAYQPTADSNFWFGFLCQIPLTCRPLPAYCTFVRAIIPFSGQFMPNTITHKSHVVCLVAHGSHIPGNAISIILIYIVLRNAATPERPVNCLNWCVRTPWRCSRVL